MRTAATNNALTLTISIARLEKYLVVNNDDLEASLTLYEHNTKLSEAFYSPLQSLEVCLRNTPDGCMCATYGHDWLHNGIAPLSFGSRNAILDAHRNVDKPEPISAGAVVAELKFSFWVGLLRPGYDATLWRKSLYRGFLQGGGKRRSDVHRRFNALRRFRNRVAHHEPIFQKNLTEVHHEIMEAIGWMCAETKAWSQYHSRVPEVIASG